MRRGGAGASCRGPCARGVDGLSLSWRGRSRALRSLGHRRRPVSMRRRRLGRRLGRRVRGRRGRRDRRPLERRRCRRRGRQSA
eukprot:6455784-Prymnesium_polylepis.1